MKTLLLAFFFSFGSVPQVLADDVVVHAHSEDAQFKPDAAHGLGRVFAYSQSLVQALDTMAWVTMFGFVPTSHTHRKVGPICEYDKTNSSSYCAAKLTPEILRDDFDSVLRRRFHVTLTHLHHIRRKALSNITKIGVYYRGNKTSWELRRTRCGVYNNHGYIKQDWPRFLTAYRNDRHGMSSSDKESYGLYFNYVKRAYSDYLKVINKLLPDLEELCESD